MTVLVGDAEQVVQAGRSVPVLGQGELAARGAQAVDDLDGDDVGRPDRLLAGRHMAIDDGVEVEQLPQPAGQKDIAEAAGVGPGDVIDANADDVGIVGQRRQFVVGKQPQLLGVALAVVKDGRALPAALLVGVEFAQVGDDLLPRPGVGANAFDEGEVGVRLAVLGARVAAEKHPPLPVTEFGPENRLRAEFPLHRVFESDRQNPSGIRATKTKNRHFHAGSAQGGLPLRMCVKRYL